MEKKDIEIEELVFGLFIHTYDIKSLFEITDDSITLNSDILKLRAVNKKLNHLFNKYFVNRLSESDNRTAELDLGEVIDYLLWNRESFDTAQHKIPMVAAIMRHMNELSIGVEKKIIRLIRRYHAYIRIAAPDYSGEIISQFFIENHDEDKSITERYRQIFLDMAIMDTKCLPDDIALNVQDVLHLTEYLYLYIHHTKFAVDEVTTNMVNRIAKSDSKYCIEVARAQADVFKLVLLHKKISLLKCFTRPPIGTYYELHCSLVREHRDILRCYETSRYPDGIAAEVTVITYLLDVANGFAEYDANIVTNSINANVLMLTNICDYLLSSDKKLNAFMVNNFAQYWRDNPEIVPIINTLIDYNQ